MKRLLAVAVVPLFLLVACNDDDPDADTTLPPAASIGTVAAGPDVVTVVATDYKFTGLPTTVPAGTPFALQNDSTKEVHEMVMIRLPDDVTETVGQLLALPEDELDAKVGEIEPSAVLVALPGETGQPVEGDGILTEPGRYAVMCFIPKGADPALVAAAMEGPPGTGQPDLGDGPPHIMEGMYAEVTVED